MKQRTTLFVTLAILVAGFSQSVSSTTIPVATIESPADSVYINVGKVKYFLHKNEATAVGVADGSNDRNGLEIPDNITYNNFNYPVVAIADRAFFAKNFKGNLTLGQNIRSIGVSAFSSNREFTGELKLPNRLQQLAKYAFWDCVGFTGTLVIPESITAIGDQTFNGCEGFTGSLILPDGITRIGAYAFWNCKGLTGTLNLPKSLTYIARNAFENCSGFTKLKLYDSLDTISDQAFFRTSITYVESHRINPPVCGTNLFKNVYNATDKDKYTLHVPSLGYDAYCKSSAWKWFKIITDLEDIELDAISGDVGNYIRLQPRFHPQTEVGIISWSSSNPEVAAVDSEGVVWFNAAGSATVTAECQGYEFSVPFMVREVMARALNVFPVEAVGGIGHEFSLLALHEPENTTDKSVTWESSDPEVATVDADGRVQLASLGTAKITARSGEHTAECAVTVDDVVSLTEMASTGVVIDIVEDGIVVRNAPAGESIAVYAVDGKVVNGAVVESEETRLKLATGIYIVKVSPATVAKVLIK